MIARLSLVVLALSLAACSVKGGEGQESSASGAGDDRASQSAAPSTISCALNGSNTFKDDCTAERSSSQGKTFVILRHPDGGFRRLEEVEAGKRFKVLDGADEAIVEANGGDFELTVGDDHYLFPGPISSGSAPSPVPG